MNNNYYSFKKLLFIGIFTVIVNSLFSQVPANDNPCSATALTVNGTCNYTNSTNANATATAGVPAPGCASYAGADVWFSAVVGSAGNLTVQTNQAAGGFADAGMAIYTGACGALSLLSCDDDNGPGNHSLLNITNPGLAGQTVYIRVWRYNNTSGSAFQICATSCDTKPVNNACTTATSIVANTPLVGTNICATTAADDPTIGQICAATIENTVWYAFTPVQTGSYTTVISGYSCVGSPTGLQVGIVTGACPGPYTAVNCTSGDGPANVTFTAMAGTTYYIVIDGNAGAQCNWTLNIQSNCTYSNITCATAATIPGLVGSNAQVCLNNICNVGAPDNSGNTSFSSCGDVSGPTLWYQITTDAGDQLLNLSAVGTGFSPHIQLWSACGTYMSGYCNVASGSTASINSIPVTGSTTYYVSVSPASGVGSGTFNLCAQSYPNPCPTLSGNCAAPSAFGAIAASTTVCKTNQCNIGAPVTYASTATSCGTFQGGQVWYSVTTPATGDFLQVSVSNSTLTDPMIQIWSSCGTMLTGACVSGTGGTATLTYDCVPSTAYIISITSASGSNTGNFDLCVNSFPDLTACNISDTLYVLSAVPPADVNGNYLPNTTVTFRYKINKYRHINLNFLQGVVPNFGGAWDQTTLAATSTPLKQANNEANSIWSFLPAGSVLYNNVSPGKYPNNTPLGTGWFFRSRNNNFNPAAASYTAAFIATLDPDLSWGDGCTQQTIGGYTNGTCTGAGGTWLGGGNCSFGCMTDPVNGFNYQWTFEFSIKTKATYDCSSPENFRVSVETFADGEVGNWTQVGCTVDQPFVLPHIAPTPAPILAAVTSVNPLCNGNSNGSITVVGSGGYSTLSYQLNAGAFGASGNFTGLAAGTYTVTIRDMILCTRSVTVTLTNPAIPTGPVASSNSPVCAGSTINLFSTTGPGITNVSWTGPSAFASALQNPTRGPATAAMAGTYSVTSLFNGCPTSTSTVAVVVNSNPTAGITPSPASVCAGVNLNMNGNPAGGAGAYSTHTWTGAGSGSLSSTTIVNPVFNNGTAGTYALTYTVIDDNGCTGASNLTVTVNALPTATATNNGPVCVGNPLTLTGGNNGMTTYAWAGPSAYANGTQSPTVSAAATAAMAGTYTLTITNASGCQQTATTAVTVNTLPTATAANNGPVCVGNPLTLTGGNNGMTTYAWAGPSAYANGTQSPTVSAAATAAMAGTYTITVTDGNGCQKTATTVVTVNALPTATATNNGPVCVGNPLTLTGGNNGMTTYAWAGPSAYANGTQSPTVSAAATAAMAGTYTLTITNGSGCQKTATTVVTVNALPTATATNNGPVCVGNPLTLTGGNNGMTTYSWSGPSAYSNATQSPTVSAASTAAMAGTYTITITDGNGCQKTATTVVTVNTLPTATATSNTPVCVGNPLTLTGGNNGMTTYAWAGPSAYANGTQSPTVSAVATAAMAGTYTITVTDGNGCQKTATTVVVINALPTATATNNGPVCVGNPLTLTGGNNGMTTYAWAGPSAYANGTQSPTVSAVATAAMAGTYTLTITNGSGCQKTATTVVTVNALPTATATNNGPVCVGNSLTLTGGNNGMTTYSWSGPSAYGNGTQSPTVSAVATVAMAGTYTITITDGNGCQKTATTVVAVNALPTATATSNSPVCIGNPLTLTGGNNGMTSYAWSGPSAYANGTQSPTVSATATAAMAGTYTVTIVDGNGCQKTATTAVTINTLPSAVGTSTAVCSGALVPAMNFTTTPATGVTVTWTNSNTGTGLAASGSGNITGYTAPVVGAQQVGVISVIATNTGTGCVSTSAPAATFTINPNPTVTTAATPANPTSCGGSDGSLTLFAAGPGVVSYSWNSGALSGSSTLAGIPAGSYSVVATDGNGCIVSANYSLTDPTSPAPPAFTFNPAALCVGGSATFTVTTPIVGQTYNWTGPNGSLGTGNTITVSPVALTDAGVYNVFTTAAGCTGSTNPAAAATLVVNATPTAVISSIGTSFCQQSTIVLGSSSSSPGGSATISTYQWYDGSGILAGQTNPTLTVSTPGTYSLMVTNSNTCSNTSAGYPVTFFSEPVMDTTAAVNSSSACTAPFTGSITGITVSGGTANYTYTWTGASGVISTSTTASTNATNLTAQPAGSYTLTIVDANGCNDTTLAFTINNLGAPSSPLVTANNSNCVGSPMNPITVNDITNTINWYSDAGLTTFVGTGNPFTPVTASTHTLYVTSTGAGCSSAATSVTVTVNPKPAAPASLGSAYCAGQTINDLTVTSIVGGTVSWYSDVLLTTVVGTGTPFVSGVSNSVAGTTSFYVAETALGCLGDYTQVDVTVNANPLIDTTAMVIDTASCDGTANGGLTFINVTGTGPLTYVWSDAAGVVSTSGSTPDLTPFPAGTYTLVVTDGNSPSCSATLSNLVINAFNQPPVPVLNLAASDTMYCDGETVTALTASASDPIFWYSDATLLTQVGAGASYTPIGLTTDATYYVIANNSGCVSSPRAVTIDFHAVPAIPTVSGATYCRGAVIADLVSSSSTVNWFADNTATVNIGSGSPFASGVTNTATIWFTDSLSYPGITCGSDTGSVTITINNIPVLDITTSLVVDSASCGASSSDGNITGATVTGTPGFTYTWSNSTGIVSTSTTTVDLLNQAAGSYTLMVTDGNTPACSATSSAITINTFSNPTNPVFATTSDTVYCTGDAVTALQAGGSTGTVNWYSDVTLLTQIGTGSPFTPTGITSSTTIYLVANSHNCNSATVPVSITFNNLPAISANSPSVCAGGQVTLSGTNASGNPTTYVWNNGAVNGVAFTPIAGPYIVTGTDGVTNCVNTFTSTVTVNSLPNVSATVGSTTAVCSGGTVTLSGSGASTYTWDNGVVDGVSFIPAGNGVYTVTGTDANNCTNTFAVSVAVNSPPTVATGVTAAIPCGSLNYVITGASTSSTNALYNWSGPSIISNGNTLSPTIGGAGLYTLTVVDNVTFCTANATLNVTSDVVVANFTPDVTSGFSPLAVNFTNQSTGALTYGWAFGDGNTSTATNPSNVFIGNGTYTVTLTAASAGCSATATVTIFVSENSSIIIPNIFSPNGDGLNDALTIQSTGLKDISINIFNRWGQQVYVIDRPGQNWDGLLSNGEPASEGTYFYMLKATGFDSKTYEAQGPVMLVK